jgi:hypothetical protein
MSARDTTLFRRISVNRFIKSGPTAARRRPSAALTTLGVIQIPSGVRLVVSARPGDVLELCVSHSLAQLLEGENGGGRTGPSTGRTSADTGQQHGL